MSNKSKKILIASIAFLLISCASFIFLFKEINKNIKNAEKAEVELQKEISKRNEIKTLNNYFKSIEKEKALLETHFIQSSDVVPFLDKLESLAKDVGTKAEVNAISVAENNQGLLVDIKDVGTFGQVYKFITLLENSPYELEFLLVDMHTFTPNNETKTTSKNKQWEAVIRLKLISFI